MEAPEPYPGVYVTPTLSGIMEAKRQGKNLFLFDAFEEAAHMFSKAAWLIHSGRVESVPGELHSILQSNCASAYLKLKRWEKAEACCSDALALNGKNVKARYRRAKARFKLGRLEEALLDAEQVQHESPKQSYKEVAALKQQIMGAFRFEHHKQEQSNGHATPAADGAGDEPREANGEFFTDGEAPATDKADANLQEADAFQDLWGANMPRDIKVTDMFREINAEPTVQGIEAVKNHANVLFSQGSFEESIRCFSMAISLVQRQLVGDEACVFDSLFSILCSNRAFAYIKLQRWQQAEEDCTKAIFFDTHNVKAKYRRALGRFRMGKLSAAMEDVDEVLEKLPNPRKNAQACQLRKEISAALLREENQRRVAQGLEAITFSKAFLD